MIKIKRSISSSKKFISDHRVAVSIVVTLIVCTAVAVRNEVLTKQLLAEIQMIDMFDDYNPYYNDWE